MSWPFRGRTRLLAGALFALVGGVFLVIGVVDGWSTHSFLSRAEHVDGVVTGSERGESCSSRHHHHHCHTVWSPAVDYVVDGHTYSFVDGRSDDSASAHPVGQHVTVAYDPDRPDDARILRKGLDNYFLSLVFGGLGIVFVPIGLVLAVVWLRGRYLA